MVIYAIHPDLMNCTLVMPIKIILRLYFFVTKPNYELYHYRIKQLCFLWLFTVLYTKIQIPLFQ